MPRQPQWLQSRGTPGAPGRVPKAHSPSCPPGLSQGRRPPCPPLPTPKALARHSRGSESCPHRPPRPLCPKAAMSPRPTTPGLTCLKGKVGPPRTRVRCRGRWAEAEPSYPGRADCPQRGEEAGAGESGQHSLEVRQGRLLRPGQDRGPRWGLGHGQLQGRRPGRHGGHEQSRLGRLPQGGLLHRHQELGLVGWHGWGLGRGRPAGGQVEGLEFIAVPGGGRGHASRAGSGAGDPGLRARALREARGSAEGGQAGQAAHRRVTHPPGGSQHPGARLRPPRAQQVPLEVLRSRANLGEAALRGRGWQQRAGAPGGEGVGAGHVGEGGLPGRGHGRRGVGWRVRQGICGAKRPSG